MRTSEHPNAETLFRRVRRRIPAISLDTVLDAIYVRRRWIDGIVVRGGEPEGVGPDGEAARGYGDLERGVVPAVEIVSGLVLLMIGALLITPGFLTDTLGFVLLVPPWRRAAAGALVRQLRVRTLVGPFGGGSATRPTSEERSGRVVIDVEPRERDPDGTSQP